MTRAGAIRLGATACGLALSVTPGLLLSVGVTHAASGVAVFAGAQGSIGDTPRAAATRGTKISGGHKTTARDNGRPVKLIASALDVPKNVFRDAFSRVTPAVGGVEPDPEQVQANKATLLATLSPYGVTNDRLDEVSDYYRLNASGSGWTRDKARVKATVKNGRVVGFRIIKSGSGYSSRPNIKVRGLPSVSVRAKIGYGDDLSSNGQIVRVRLRG